MGLELHSVLNGIVLLTEESGSQIVLNAPASFLALKFLVAAVAKSMFAQLWLVCQKSPISKKTVLATIIYALITL